MLKEIVDGMRAEYQDFCEINDAYKDTHKIVQELRKCRKLNTDPEVIRLGSAVLLTTHLLEITRSECYDVGARLYLAFHPRYDKFLEQVKAEFRKNSD